MCEYNIAKRLKCLVDRECALTRRAISITKIFAKYKDEMTKLEHIVWHQREELVTSCRQVAKIQNHQNKVSKFIEDKEARLQEVKQRNVELEEQLKQHNAERLRQQLNIQQQMYILRCLKESTNTLLNLHALPNRIQGALICEKINRTQLLPFCISQQSLSQQDMSSLSSHERKELELLYEEWRKLWIRNEAQQNEFKSQRNENFIVDLAAIAIKIVHISMKYKKLPSNKLQ